MALDLPQPRFAPATPETLTLSDTRTPALLIQPDAPGPHPGAVIQHGWASRKTDMLPFALVLATFGVACILPDAWGHGEHPAASAVAGTSSVDTFVEVIRETTRGIREALHVLAVRPDIRPDMLLVGGFSMGGIAALIAGAEDERVAGIVSLAGASLSDMMGVPPFGVGRPGPEAQRWAEAHDVRSHASLLAPRPLLLSHGRRDDMVPVEGSTRLYEAARPYYGEHSGRLALKLYDHTHTVTQEQVTDALAFIWQFIFPRGRHAAAR